MSFASFRLIFKLSNHATKQMNPMVITQKFIWEKIASMTAHPIPPAITAKNPIIIQAIIHLEVFLIIENIKPATRRALRPHINLSAYDVLHALITGLMCRTI